jgi:predicted transcriptional regulator of viral defense system
MTKYNLLLKSNKNVFTVDDLVLLWSSEDRRKALESVKGYIRAGKLFSVHKGVYSLDEEYSRFELAQKLYTPSYISYLTALAFHGIVFQYYEDIHLFAENSKNIEVGNEKYIFHKAKDRVLYNDKGIIQIDNYNIASPERAVCDSLYLNPNIGFDNLEQIDENKLTQISMIYENKLLIKRVSKLIENLRNVE